jgi:LysM repeat protein
MDTISQENNSSFSYLPVLALIIALIALVLGAVALAKVSSVSKTVGDQDALVARVNDLETQLRNTVTSAEQATNRINKVANDTNTAFKQFSDAFTELRTDVAGVKEAVAKPAPVTVAATANAGPAVAAPGEYILKSGDTGSKIARNAGVSLSALLAVNPSVNWNRLGVGQAIKLPQK